MELTPKEKAEEFLVRDELFKTPLTEEEKHIKDLYGNIMEIKLISINNV